MKFKKYKKYLYVVILIVLFIIGIYIISVSSYDTFYCESDEGTISFKYNEKEEKIKVYRVSSIKFKNIVDPKEYKNINVLARISDIEENITFKTTNGKCYINGELIPNNYSRNLEYLKDDELGGNEEIGYFSIPTNWEKDNLKYNWNNVYFFEIGFVDEKINAKNKANDYYNSLNTSNEYVNLSNMVLPKNDKLKYDMYQVSGIKKSNGYIVITYFFEAEDGKVRFMRLEGPEKDKGLTIGDLLFIPESYSLKK